MTTPALIYVEPKPVDVRPWSLDDMFPLDQPAPPCDGTCSLCGGPLGEEQHVHAKCAEYEAWLDAQFS